MIALIFNAVSLIDSYSLFFATNPHPLLFINLLA